MSVMASPSRQCTRRDRTTYNTRFLNKRKRNPSQSVSNLDANQPPKKKHKFAKRKKMSKQLLYDFITFAHTHSHLSIEDCLKKPQFVNKISLNIQTLQKYRTHYALDSEKYKKLQMDIITNPQSNNIYRLPTNPEHVKYGRFPTIEKYILKTRKERKQPSDPNKQPRDTSIDWMMKEIGDLLKNPEALNAMNLTQYEMENISDFKGGEGYCRKLMVCILN